MFTAAQIDTLRAEYATINGIDPCAPSYRKLIAMVDGQTQATLRQLAGAKIKFVSALARNRVR